MSEYAAPVVSWADYLYSFIPEHTPQKVTLTLTHGDQVTGHVLIPEEIIDDLLIVREMDWIYSPVQTEEGTFDYEHYKLNTKTIHAIRLGSVIDISHQVRENVTTRNFDQIKL